MKYTMIKDISINKTLIPIVKHINQEKINKFGIATGSTGAVHVDPIYCNKLPFKTTLAHGFLTLAYASEMMEINFGIDWAYTGDIEVKFVGAAKPGDSIIVSGTISNVEVLNGKSKIYCNIDMKNQNEDKILVGTASVILEK